MCRRYKLEPTQAIIRHYDVTGKVCPKYYVEDVGAFKRLKEEVKGKMGEDKELVKAVKVLQEKGIISSPEVWIKGNYTKDNVRSLVIKVSSYVDKI